MIAPSVSAERLRVLVFDDGKEGPALAIVWTTQGQPNKVLGQIFNLENGTLRAAGDLLGTSESGPYRDLFLSYESGGLRLLASQSGEKTDVVDHYFSPSSLGNADLPVTAPDADESDVVDPDAVSDTTGSTSSSGGGCRQAPAGSTPVAVLIVLVLVVLVGWRRRALSG